MHPVDEFIFSHEGKQREIMLFISHLLLDQPGITGKITFKIPFFYRKSWLCYLNPVKNGGVELVFTRGTELSNASGLLKANGRKLVMGIVFYNLSDIPPEVIMENIHEAILLDERKPEGSRRKSGQSLPD